MKIRKDKGFWLTVAAVACILIYILIPALKIAGVIQDYDTTLTSALLIAGAALYFAGRRETMKRKNEENQESGGLIEETGETGEENGD